MSRTDVWHEVAVLTIIAKPSSDAVHFKNRGSADICGIVSEGMFGEFSLNSWWKARTPALLCSFILLACMFATFPVAEIGMNDDWSYIKSAQVLAQTSHIVYNGWASAMLGWQLLFGALVARLVSPSYTAIRASTVLVALAMAFLMQRTLTRAGVSPRNATIGTLALVLSPLALPLEVSFMTDIGGLFCIVLCLYSCLRALQAENDRATLAWLAFAALSNAIGGTVRQIVWLGVLVMFPLTVWQLRQRRWVLGSSVVLYAVSSVFIFGAMHWFQLQPYSLHESILPDNFDRLDISNLFTLLSVAVFISATFLLPILFAFVPAVSKRFRRRRDFLVLGGMLCVTFALFWAQRGSHSFAGLLAPYPGNYVTEHGLVDGTWLHGTRLTVLSPGVRVGLSMAIDLTTYCFLAFAYSSRSLAGLEQGLPRISLKSLLLLLVPFALVYFALLVPRGLTRGYFDRYFLPLLFIGTILVSRLFQDRVQAHLPTASVILTSLYAVFAVLGTHDAFSLYRAQATAFAEVRSAGIPANLVDGGFEQNGITQIERAGTINDPRIRVPDSFHFSEPSAIPVPCAPMGYWLVPSVIPAYALSFDPAACGGPSRFAPVTYHNWLAPHTGTIYIVNAGKTPSS